MKPLWLLVVLLAVCVCASTTSATDFSWESIYAEEEARTEKWLLECPEEERIILRSPMNGEPIYLTVGSQPAYIAVEDVRKIVRQVLAEEDLPPLRIVAGVPSPALQLTEPPPELARIHLTISEDGVIKVNREVYDCHCLVCDFLRERYREER